MFRVFTDDDASATDAESEAGDEQDPCPPTQRRLTEADLDDALSLAGAGEDDEYDTCW